MMSPTKKKLFSSLAGILTAFILLTVSTSKIPFLDTPTDQYFKQSITKAGLAYTSCRIINASVSVIQNSTLELEPAGVGISLAVGQIVDPIDDMTERLSDVLVTAIVSLGVQKLIYEMSFWFAPYIIAVLILILSALIWVKNSKMLRLQHNLIKLIFLVIALRMCLPISSLINSVVNHYFFEERIEMAHRELTLGTEELDKLSEFSLPKTDGFMGTIQNSAHFLAVKAKQFKEALSKLSDNMDNMIDNLLRLSFLYVGLFVIQVIILPILSFWGITKLFNSLFSTNIPVILKQNTNKPNTK